MQKLEQYLPVRYDQMDGSIIGANHHVLARVHWEMGLPRSEFDKICAGLVVLINGNCNQNAVSDEQEEPKQEKKRGRPKGS